MANVFWWQGAGGGCDISLIKAGRWGLLWPGKCHLGFCADVMLVRFWGRTRWSFKVPSNPNRSLILILSEHKGLLLTAVLSVGRLWVWASSLREVH